MPSAPKPKKFYAVREITIGGRRYEVGDAVTDQRALGRLLRYGEQFVAVKRAKQTPAVDTATTPPESTKED